MSLSPALLWTVLSLTLGGVGALVFLWAIFWDRARGRLRCPKCWYDMKGAVEAGPVPGDEGETRVSREPPWTCPECGKKTTKIRRLKRTRQRHLPAILAACALLTGLYGIVVRDRFAQDGWWGAAPTLILVLIPADYSDWHNRWVMDWGAPPPVTWRTMVRDHCTERFDDKEMLGPHLWLWSRTMLRDVKRSGVAVVSESDRRGYAAQRVNRPSPAYRTNRVSLRRLDVPVSGLHAWDASTLQLELRHAVRGIVDTPGVYMTLESLGVHYPLDEPYTSMTPFGKEYLGIGPMERVLAFEMFARDLRRAHAEERMVPLRSESDLDDLHALDSLRTGSDASRLSGGEALVLLTSLTGQDALLAPGLNDFTSRTITLDGEPSVATLCDLVAAALTPQPGYDPVHWTLSRHGIEFGNRLELSHLLEPRVYSLEPLLLTHKRRHRRIEIDWNAERRRALTALFERSSKEGWLDNGGNVMPIGPLFVVYSTPNVHARVARFLMEYAAAQQEPIPVTPPDRRGGR